MRTTLYGNESGLRHDTGYSHPECANRLKVIFELFGEEPFSCLPRGTVISATEEQLMLAHPFHYIERVLHSVPERGHAMLDQDTFISPGSWTAALDAAGAVCSAVDDIAHGKTTRAFCAVRPPGHHAEHATSMGFCLFNNIFIGARHAQVAHGFNKIAIVDFDVHHGNGTDTMSRQHDGSILAIGSHQYPLYRNTGLEEDNDQSVMNFTLPPDSGSKELRTLYNQKIFPALRDFAPDLLMISAGFDAHRADPYANLNWVEEDFGWVTEELVKIANTSAKGRIMSVLEGGYDLDALKASVAAHLKVLAGF